MNIKFLSQWQSNLEKLETITLMVAKVKKAGSYLA